MKKNRAHDEGAVLGTQIIDLLRERISATDSLIAEERAAGRRMDAGILLRRREETKAILSMVLELVKGAVDDQDQEKPHG